MFRVSEYLQSETVNTHNPKKSKWLQIENLFEHLLF